MKHKIHLRSNAAVLAERGMGKFEAKPVVYLGPDQDVVTTQKNIEYAKE